VKLGLGAVTYNATTTGPIIALLAEVIGTAILVFTVFGAAVDGRAPAGFAGIVIGFIVYGIIILVGPITGAALNPAREIGPNLVQSLIGAATKWDQVWVYIAGPILGGLGGAFLYQFVGHTVTSDVPGPAVAEAPHAERVGA
jgi:glycerol uptake facilitator protein